MRKIPLFKVFMSPEAAPAVTEVLNSGFIGEGEQVKEFEKELGSCIKHYPIGYHDGIVTTNSATSAEHLIYHYLKKDRKLIRNEFNGVVYTDDNWEALEPGDEVLATALTCTATNWPIINSGLNLKWVDVDPLTLN